MVMYPRKPGSNRGKATSPHSFRTTDDVWEKAKYRAKKDGVPMNYVIEQFVIGYASGALQLPTVTISYGQNGEGA